MLKTQKKWLFKVDSKLLKNTHTGLKIQVFFGVGCSVFPVSFQHIHHQYLPATFLWECIAGWVRSCSHWPPFPGMVWMREVEVNAQCFCIGLVVCKLFAVVRGDGVQHTFERHKFPDSCFRQWNAVLSGEYYNPGYHGCPVVGGEKGHLCGSCRQSCWTPSPRNAASSPQSLNDSLCHPCPLLFPLNPWNCPSSGIFCLFCASACTAHRHASCHAGILVYPLMADHIYFKQAMRPFICSGL